MAGGEPEPGDKASWNWGGGAPGGTVAEVKHDDKVEIESKRGNKIAKKGEPNNPAVHIERSSNDVVKKASELNIEKKGSGKKGGSDKKEDKGTKRKADDEGDDPHVKNNEGKEVKPGGKDSNKRQMKDKEAKEDAADKKEKEKEKTGKKEVNGTEKKKAGRPKGSSGAKKDKKEPAARKEGDMVSTRTRSRGKK